MDSSLEIVASISLYYVQLIPALIVLSLFTVFVLLLLRGKFAVALAIAGMLGATCCMFLGIAFLTSRSAADHTAGAVLLVGGIACLIWAAFLLQSCRNGAAHSRVETPAEP